MGTEYLKYPKEKVKNYMDLKNLRKINFSNNNELDTFISPWLIEKLKLK